MRPPPAGAAAQICSLGAAAGGGRGAPDAGEILRHQHRQRDGFVQQPLRVVQAGDVLELHLRRRRRVGWARRGGAGRARQGGGRLAPGLLSSTSRSRASTNGLSSALAAMGWRLGASCSAAARAAAEVEATSSCFPWLVSRRCRIGLRAREGGWWAAAPLGSALRWRRLRAGALGGLQPLPCHHVDTTMHAARRRLWNAQAGQGTHTFFSGCTIILDCLKINTRRTERRSPSAGADRAQ